MKKTKEVKPEYKSISISDAYSIISRDIGNNKDKDKTQDPDSITMFKQWSEFGGFKGYWADVKYVGGRGFEDLIISFDITPHYVRVLGDLHKIPLYTKGVHNYPDTPKAKKLTPKVNVK